MNSENDRNNHPFFLLFFKEGLSWAGDLIDSEDISLVLGQLSVSSRGDCIGGTLLYSTSEYTASSSSSSSSGSNSSSNSSSSSSSGSSSGSSSSNLVQAQVQLIQLQIPALSLIVNVYIQEVS